MSFRDWQAQYAQHGIAAFPVRVNDGSKVPAIRGWQRVGLNRSAKLAQQFAGADALGFCPGRRSRVTVLDIDTPDERILADAIDRHGDTPIIVRSGSGNHQAWYRHNGEKRLIRPEPDKPIDVLGSGFVIAPPSIGTKSNYQFIQGRLDDIDHLPCLRGIQPNIEGQTVATALGTKCIREGDRNNTLFRQSMKAAHSCDDFSALINVARTRNDEFLPPLPDDEVVKVARSAWRYTELGENRMGCPGVWFPASEANHLIRNDPDGYLLLSYLRANNSPKRAFMIANGLERDLPLTRKRIAAARQRLTDRYVRLVRPASKQGGAALYRWISKGGQN